jgi:hypothetical protein
MSMFLPDAKPQERESAKGPEAYLSPDERKALQRSLSFPEDLPPKFKSWLIDFMAVNIPQIPISQIVGFSQFTATPVIVAPSEATTSMTYVNLATTGPEITGLGKGQYIFFVSCQVVKGAVNDGGLASLSYNASTPADTDSVILFSDSSIAQNTTISRGLQKTLTAANNIVTMKYRTINGNSISFANRSLITLRYGN